MLGLSGVRLANFRSYGAAEIAIDRRSVVLAGANGAGKTNLLEAISLLGPGRGLRGAKLAEHVRRAPAPAPDADTLWAVSATVARGDGDWEIGTGLAPATGGGEKRLMRLNGAPAPSVADIAEILPMLWLTPAMDRLFIESPGGRRRFLDRLVLGLDTAHARRAARYETAMRERLRLLRDGRRDPAWLEGLEETMAETGAAIAAARARTVSALNAELDGRAHAGAFPSARLSVDAEPSEDALASAFAASRERDAEAGRTTAGPHVADLAVRHAEKRADARDCSTGEQKALLISIVLANARLQARARDGFAPILLLDEIAAHLDARRRAALFEEILALGTQAWMTGTDLSLFEALGADAQTFLVASQDSGSRFLRQE